MKKQIYIVISAALVLLASIALLAGCQEKYHDIEDPGWPEDKEEPAIISVMSYNIKYGSPLNSDISNIDATAEVIKNAAPDIAFIQEVDLNTTRSGKKDQLAIISKAADMPYYYFAKTQDYQGGATGVGILSKYPLSNTTATALSRTEIPGQYVGHFVLATALIDVNGKKATIATSHFALDELNQASNAKEVLEVLSASNYPVIFGGDFNALPNSSTMETLFSNGFKRSCLSLICYTIPSDKPNREIDYILGRPEIKLEVKSHEVLKEAQASDHLPIMTVYELK